MTRSEDKLPTRNKVRVGHHVKAPDSMKMAKIAHPEEKRHSIGYKDRLPP